MLKIFNTLSGEKEVFTPLEDNKVKIYVCGVTVYDYCHIGHARSSIVFDTIRRYLKYKGFDVTFVKNFTDVDDKIIKRANEENKSINEITDFFIKAHDEDMDKLNILRPDYTPRATEYIDGMIKLCEKLIEKGFAYESNGDVYFKVRAFKDYGKLSKRDLDDLLAGARVDVNEIKEDPLDFALWKRSKEGEPGWDSPWGRGRPGWHIECSVMSAEILGIPFDIHGGGKDLIFPHHENEIAQSEAAEGKEFARYWIHNGFVNINKEKMSKSLGNFFTIRDVLKEVDPEVLRFFLLTTHYRSPLDFSFENLLEAENALDRIYTAIDELESAVFNNKKPAQKGKIDEIVDRFKRDFEESMDDDFNTASAISNIFELIKGVNLLLSERLNSEDLNYLKVRFEEVKAIIRDVLGILTKTASEWFKMNLSIDESELQKLIEEREIARRNKDFSKADAIRNELKTKGVELLDTPTGTKFRAKRLRGG
ncbi:cysteinyl-tRNA synthetase [Calditerrivibrio nitroreducens DSM 19672]|uniref:Cysteine--tRNA ligase n=2 Tax=Calditerrivibrio nitroreducens TaxID=477976 RepID=E4TEJ4_CALNY|nr:cysteine--tRNA ligase [Calditerrivibrio nitroreducens]ADR18320.1 cysteinyl-tRNA synthetase [Calditerrivibrio nitroreducens DSM 19672]